MGEQKAASLSLKKKLLILNLIFDLVIVLPIILFFVLVPRTEIRNLKDHYVKVTQQKKNHPVYKIVKKQPREWVRLKDMNYTAIHAIVVSEDWFFYGHNGYDLGQIKDAVLNSVQKGKRLRGASTISQQLVKNLFLNNNRSFVRKLEEVVFSIYLERHVKKEKILETYLNIIQYGDGIYGIKAASRHYFHKSPKQLTAREGAFLAMLLPNPIRHAQSFKDKKLTDFAKKAIDSILEKLKRAKYIKESQLKKFMGQNFLWEKNSSLPHENGQVKSPGKRGHRRKSKHRSVKVKGSSGDNYEANYKSDKDLELDDNPEFDEDAIIEDTSGVEEEFNVD